jgi:hypothetical protein
MVNEDDEWKSDDEQVMTIEDSLKKAREDNDSHKPHKESEVLLIKPLQIRLRNRKTPRGQIECQIGGTVKPRFCKRCAYATHCQNYESHLKTKVSKLKEFYWRFRAWFSSWIEYLRVKFPMRSNE